MPTIKKLAKKGSKSNTAKPGMLGTGMAAKAGSAIMKRKQRNCKLQGGKWAGGKCVY